MFVLPGKRERKRKNNQSPEAQKHKVATRIPKVGILPIKNY